MCRSQANRAVVNYYLHGGFTGGGYVESHIFQKGSGIGSILRGIGKAALPLLKKAGKYLGKTALGVTSNTIGDLLDGENLGSAITKNLSSAAENTKFDIAQRFALKRPQTGPKKASKKKRRKKTASKTLW
jgi:hypothetical protein